ncbi:MAG TPA: hypothetical protein VGZ26_01120 [Pirellulales bacterium]|jgi:hypothetical protein|nr:hypothetical protein [Pirellulales bacterium]
MTRGKHRDTERTVRAADETEAVDTPKKGDIFRCEECGMELEITADCGCADADAVHFQCCGQEMMRL